MQNSWYEKVLNYIDEFEAFGQTGVDPFSRVFEERRNSYALTTRQLTDAQIESFRKYIFCYDKLPTQKNDKPVKVFNFIAGAWKTSKNKEVSMPALFDKRITLSLIPDSADDECEEALSYAFNYYKSFEWTKDTLAYRKHVVKNFSRILNYYYEELCKEIRTVIPKTQLECDKDFWEAKRAADHLEGSSEVCLRSETIPTMIEGHTYWKNKNIPAGVSVIFTPMNFVYGIPTIQFIGAYLVGAPFILKGHPFAAICSTTLIRILMASGADPRMVQKVEGFGGKIGKLVSDRRVAVVSVTGAESTAQTMMSKRGLRPVKFEGGGVNWAFIDDNFSDEELNKIVVRLTYSKLGFSSHKCTTLHGIMSTPNTMKRLIPLLNQEFDKWDIKNPAFADKNETKIIGPCMVHQAQTATEIEKAAKQIGITVIRSGGKLTGNDYADNAEVIAPIILGNVKPNSTITVNWDSKGEITFDLSTTELFMPILCLNEVEKFDEFLRFCLFHNEHDLAVSIWTKDSKKIELSKKLIGGMLKINDGTDSAMEWEEFGASGLTGSGNMGVGDPEATFAIYSRRQKGRFVVF